MQDLAREKAKERNREWRKRNAQKIREYLAANREKINARNREYYHAHKEYYREYHAVYDKNRYPEKKLAKIRQMQKECKR